MVPCLVLNSKRVARVCQHQLSYLYCIPLLLNPSATFSNAISTSTKGQPSASTFVNYQW